LILIAISLPLNSKLILHLEREPVVVVPLLSDSTCAIAASYEAKLKGIKTGKKIYEAKKLALTLYVSKVGTSYT